MIFQQESALLKSWEATPAEEISTAWAQPRRTMWRPELILNGAEPW